ncbi:hypothetical protein P170DRAFT_221776 [Aspergillus steynii IBT 23096]|uniref:Uncharacterized protein n=1 Tax=Aspergillus steynii IBT 23096 TaxID=1392250 RepID=A0A2I2G1N5_9EURO|nr:uncharacterized protein P170DRAFT_221776 [Aspergillus steynii IBT 23096]PLB46773.1 hypothetical protein P170DRAFT_221776 [Aspergillus steynii IBT 23096]
MIYDCSSRPALTAELTVVSISFLFILFSFLSFLCSFYFLLFFILFFSSPHGERPWNVSNQQTPSAPRNNTRPAP